MAADLYIASDDFGIFSLRAICQRLLNYSISVENVAWTLHSAERLNIPMLKDRCLQYISMYFDDVIKTEGFLMLPRALLVEVLKKRGGESDDEDGGRKRKKKDRSSKKDKKDSSDLDKRRQQWERQNSAYDGHGSAFLGPSVATTVSVIS
eukprot:TRINITY_DN13324_c0_g1_i1.p1 TRINITY_DN13324_c0_g1~~TRINITY_DN13324_c0_g1_i1.p1  ORF type:complete len:157 (-),score=20.50 TRINITY_DN13324_c0_g1_i1:4-453(-)